MLPSIIAVVDDDADISSMVDDLLTDEGYQVICYGDSASLLNGLADTPPKLLILDLHLEQYTSGWEILTEIRHRAIHDLVPIIVTTTDDEFGPDQQEHLRSLNATVFYKPFDLEPLLTTIRQVLRP